ncbi:MAG: S-layer homology domain-containing protein, partial [Bacillota bacterium]|nr:S-layer homology domain-containing protein [Bacillota bacterium]
MKNKLLALILALSMVFSILVLAPTTAVAAETDENVANEATTVLMALNILQGTADGSLQLSSNITRAEFASMLARTLRGTDELNSNAGAVMNTTPSETPDNVSMVKSANTAAVSAPGKALANVGSTYSTSIDSTDYVDPSYSDVSALHWAYNDIEYLRGIGVISGYSDGTFKPDDNILYEDAVKFIVSALGYDFMAVTYGGYPNGYMRTANTLKILKNATGTTGLSATRQQVIVMLFNALTVDYLVLDKVSDGLNVYESGKNILKYIFDVEKIEGTVTANEDSGIYALSQASDEGKIEIGSDEFKCNVDQYKKYLGYPVTAYVKYDDDNATTGTLYAMFPESNIRTQKITSEDIISANITGNSNTVEAYINDKEETIKLADEPLIIYDGVAYGRNVSDATFNIEFGNVTFVSTDGSRTYDLILIEDYLPMYVDKVNASSLKFSGTVYSEGQIINDYEVCLDEDENDITAYIFNADGTEAKFSDIKEDSVVYVKKWGTYIAVDLGGQVISGAVSGKSGEDVFVNDTKYDSISSNLLAGY